MNASSSASITIHMSPEDCKHMGSASTEIIESLKAILRTFGKEIKECFYTISVAIRPKIFLELCL